MATTTPTWDVPWSPLLQSCHANNYDSSLPSDRNTRGVPFLASLTSISTTPKLQPLPFLSFLPSDPRVLLFPVSARNQDLIPALKLTSQTHELAWHLPKTNDLFILSGKCFLVPAPSLSGRLGTGPRGIVIPVSDGTDDFWQDERVAQFRRLSPRFRAEFSWPPTGEPRGLSASSSHQDINTTQQALSDISLSSSSPVPSSPTTTTPSAPQSSTTTTTSSRSKPLPPVPILQVKPKYRASIAPTLHTFKHTSLPASPDDTTDEEVKEAVEFALENFCLVVFRVLKVEYVKYQGTVDGVPERRVWTANRDGSWLEEALNP